MPSHDPAGGIIAEIMRGESEGNEVRIPLGAIGGGAIAESDAVALQGLAPMVTAAAGILIDPHVNTANKAAARELLLEATGIIKLIAVTSAMVRVDGGNDGELTTDEE